MTFSLNSNKFLENTVKNIISSDRIPHAIIIEGNEGSGRHSLAHYLATACVCENDGSAKPCGNCKGCHLASLNNHTDITTLLPEEGKKNITVAQIRDIREKAFIKPRLNDKKVFIIDGAHKMNEQAQNALLKVLEEPPKNVIFILIVPSRTLMLDTVVSRCTLLTLQSDTVSKNDDAIKKATEDFIENLFLQNDYEMLKILRNYEKSRNAAEDFFMQLKKTAVKKLRECDSSKTKSTVLEQLYRQIDQYLKLLKTNINLSLLFSAAVAKAVKLTD